MKKLLFLLIILLLVTPVLAVPNYSDKYVNDYANILTPSESSDIRNLFYNIDQTTTAEMTILTVDTVAPMAMSQYAQEVFDLWEIGKADKDNGLLMLYAKQENKIWVSVGYGLEGILTDSKIGLILDQTFVPARSSGNVSQGLVLAAHAYADVINKNANEVRSGDVGPPIGDTVYLIFAVLMPFIWIIGIFISIIYFGYLKQHPKCKCGGRSDIIDVEEIVERKKGIFGIQTITIYSIVTYRCRKCNKTFKKKVSGKYRRTSAGFVLASGGGGFGGGGFSGGGFGGGGGGGGGAGR